MTKPLDFPVSLNVFTCFEAAGRHSNFTLAARELGVTQAAVSRQIKALETQLDARLFERGNKAVQLTSEGKKLFDAVTIGLKTIGGAMADITAKSKSNELSITTTVAMASLWAMPHIADFCARHPEIGIKLVASDGVLDFAEDRIDVAIRYGNGRWPNLDATLLFGVKFFPVCSPTYRAQFPASSIEELMGARLLHLDGPAAPYSDWQWWFTSNGVEHTRAEPHLSFNNYPLLVQAALSGQGVILAWGNVIDDLLASGSLVRMIDGHTVANQSYYIVTDRRRMLSSNASAFRRWILEKTAHLR